MENASKALIIAGAILISIILISIGIMVIQSGNQLVDEAGGKMDAQALQAYNAEFVNYVGKQRGSTVRCLIQAVQANNATHEDLPITVTVLTESFEAANVGQALNKIKTSTQYEVELGYSDAGRVNQITVKSATGSES